MVAEFIRHARTEVVTQMGEQLANRAFQLIQQNGYRNHSLYPLLESTWATIEPAISIFLAGPNSRLQIACHLLYTFLNFSGRWDEWLALTEQAESKALISGDYLNAGRRAYHIGWVAYRRADSDTVILAADRAMCHWKAASAGPKEMGLATRLRGIGHLMTGENLAARDAFCLALKLHRLDGNVSAHIANALNSLAEVELVTGEFVLAKEHYLEALGAAESASYLEGRIHRYRQLSGAFFDSIGLGSSRGACPQVAFCRRANLPKGACCH